MAETFASSQYARPETALWARMQYAERFVLEMCAAINSRSATDQPDWPRMASWVSAFIWLP